MLTAQTCTTVWVKKLGKDVAFQNCNPCQNAVRLMFDSSCNDDFAFICAVDAHTGKHIFKAKRNRRTHCFVCGNVTFSVGRCPPGFTFESVSGNCHMYQPKGTVANWFQANAFCQARGSELISYHSLLAFEAMTANGIFKKKACCLSIGSIVPQTSTFTPG